MALTAQSLAAAAKRKTARAQRHVDAAEVDLKDANKKLEQAIPLGDTEEITDAHERTQRAEKAVVDASRDLEVAGELLEQQLEQAAQDPGGAGPHVSGEGLKSLLDTIKKSKNKKPS